MWVSCQVRIGRGKGVETIFWLFFFFPPMSEVFAKPQSLDYQAWATSSPESMQDWSLHCKHIIKTLGQLIKIMILKRKIVVETKQIQP